MKKTTPAKQTVYDRVQFILASAKDFAAHLVNTAQVVANWLIGREIVEDQQQGNKRAGYGKQLIAGLACNLKGDGVTGYGELTLHLCRQFYLNYPDLPGGQIFYAPRKESTSARPMAAILRASRNNSASADSPSLLVPSIIEAVRTEKWRPGLLHPSLSWTHYRTLMRVGNLESRANSSAFSHFSPVSSCLPITPSTAWIPPS